MSAAGADPCESVGVPPCACGHRKSSHYFDEYKPAPTFCLVFRCDCQQLQPEQSGIGQVRASGDERAE